MIRAVLDANVFVSAILSPKGPPAKALTAWNAEKFQLVVSEPILEEIHRVLQYRESNAATDAVLMMTPRSPSSSSGSFFAICSAHNRSELKVPIRFT